MLLSVNHQKFAGYMILASIKTSRFHRDLILKEMQVDSLLSRQHIH